MTLIRTAFWLSLVLFFLPIGHNAVDPETQVSPGEAFSAARAAVQDFAGFCDRNPDACTTGRHAVSYLGDKAEYSARMIYDYLSNDGAENSAGDAPMAQTVEGPKEATPAEAQNTLTPSDLEPVWRAPGSV
ncbi:MAG: DUF5330 domain-containing protein [Hyphomicrobiales bacterium]|nr:DUF5330 domain-containing protein [Hyphomicrobiales bacterium]